MASVADMKKYIEGRLNSVIGDAGDFVDELTVSQTTQAWTLLHSGVSPIALADIDTSQYRKAVVALNNGAPVADITSNNLTFYNDSGNLLSGYTYGTSTDMYGNPVYGVVPSGSTGLSAADQEYLDWEKYKYNNLSASDIWNQQQSAYEWGQQFTADEQWRADQIAQAEADRAQQAAVEAERIRIQEAQLAQQAAAAAENLRMREAELAEMRRQWNTLSAYQREQVELGEAQLNQDKYEFQKTYQLSVEEFNESKRQFAETIRMREEELAEMRRQWDTLSAYQKAQVELEEARLEEDKRQFGLAYQLDVDTFNENIRQFDETLAFQKAAEKWNQDWAMAQSPSSPQPSGFAGYGKEYQWSPNAAMQGENGWLTAAMSAQNNLNPDVYGSTAWANDPANWYSVAQLDRGLASDQQINQMVPSVVANYFQGIEPWQKAQTVDYSQEGGNPYQMSSMPSLGRLDKLTSNQLAQLESAYENLHSQYSWEDVLRNAYQTAPPTGSSPTLLY